MPRGYFDPMLIQCLSLLKDHPANTSPRLIGSPKFTQGIWLIHVFWLERVYLIGNYKYRPVSPAQFRLHLL